MILSLVHTVERDNRERDSTASIWNFNVLLRAVSDDALMADGCGWQWISGRRMRRGKIAALFYCTSAQPQTDKPFTHSK
jgi:hypothetical protein